MTLQWFLISLESPLFYATGIIITWLKNIDQHSILTKYGSTFLDSLIHRITEFGQHITLTISLKCRYSIVDDLTPIHLRTGSYKLIYLI
jgi:hypothetical protein